MQRHSVIGPRLLSFLELFIRQVEGNKLIVEDSEKRKNRSAFLSLFKMYYEYKNDCIKCTNYQSVIGALDSILKHVLNYFLKPAYEDENSLVRFFDARNLSQTSYM